MSIVKNPWHTTSMKHGWWEKECANPASPPRWAMWDTAATECGPRSNTSATEPSDPSPKSMPGYPPPAGPVASQDCPKKPVRFPTDSYGTNGSDPLRCVLITNSSPRLPGVTSGIMDVVPCEILAVTTWMPPHGLLS